MNRGADFVKHLAPPLRVRTRSLTRHREQHNQAKLGCVTHGAGQHRDYTTNMNLIAVTDIFGKTKAFEKLVNEISDNFNIIEIVDPYENKDFNFHDELEAYTYFKKFVGVEKYVEIVGRKIQPTKNINQLLLGFSVGSTAIWVLSKKLNLLQKTKGICFYSSQIRNYLEINPKIEIDVYFSKHEPTYNVNEINIRISEKVNVKCFKTKYLHGFMNERSKNFNQKGYDRYLNILKKVHSGRRNFFPSPHTTKHGRIAHGNFLLRLSQFRT